MPKSSPSESDPVKVRQVDEVSGSPAMHEVLQRPAMKKAQALMRDSLIMRKPDGSFTVADIDEVEAYDYVGDRYKGNFQRRERQPNEWFVQSMRGGRVYCVVVDPLSMSVVRIKTVRVNGRKTPLSGVMKEHFGERDFDGEPLPESQQLLRDGAEVFLTPKAAAEVTLEVRTDAGKVLGTIVTVK